MRSIWDRDHASATTGRPAQRSRPEIVAAAIAVAEADGLAAVTMRRVAGELGTGAASLYRHLDTRDDLLDLMIDQVLGAYRPPEITGDPHADVVADLVERLRFIRRHPWFFEAVEARPAMSPERIRMIELSLERLADHPAPGLTKLETVAVLAGLLHNQLRAERDADDPAVAGPMIELLSRAAADGHHPHLARTLRLRRIGSDPSPDERFADVLARTLAGLLPRDP